MDGAEPLSPLRVSALWYRLAVLTVLGVMLSCRDARSGDIPGMYTVKTEWGDSTLVLRPDHSMKQEVHKRNGSSRQISGSWSFADQIVTLKPCLEVRSDVEGELADGCAKGVTVSALGKIEITVDSQYGLAYQRHEEH